MEAVRQEHPGLPTTPPNSSQFVYLFSACLHMARDEVSLLLPFPLISWVLWPLVFPILPFLSLHSDHFQQNTYLFYYLHCLQSLSFTPWCPTSLLSFTAALSTDLSFASTSSPPILHSALCNWASLSSIPLRLYLMRSPMTSSGHFSVLTWSLSSIDHSLLEWLSSLGFWILYAFGCPLWCT